MKDDPKRAPGRRKFLARASYVAPAILTLKAAPAYAKNGSEKPPGGPGGPPWSGGPGGPAWSGGPGGKP